MAKSILLEKADNFAHNVYQVTRKFPKEELYSLTSQLRRSALSVPLNITEGFARQNRKEHRHFLEIAYGSLKESSYLIEFSLKEGYLTQEEFDELFLASGEIARILWKQIQTLKSSISKQ